MTVSQVREILLQLDAAKTTDFRAKLQRELGSGEYDVGIRNQVGRSRRRKAARDAQRPRIAGV